MANNPKRMQDPTEAALSAIQEALNVRDLEEESKPRDLDAPVPDGTIGGDTAGDLRAENWRRSEWTPPTAADEFFPFENGREAPAAPEPMVPRRPANDDQQAIGQVLQSIQRRPPRTSYLAATIFAAIWIVAGLGLSWIYLPDLRSLIGQSSAGVPALLGLGALFLVPVIFFYIMAHMFWRAQEMRLVAQSMAEVALRLADPETVARESIVTVGQAIRREVAAMGDGVERALARAAELETLVHNEVSALERAYNDNEVRIRGLLQDLATQRDTLVDQADQVRNAITNVHLDLSQDITSISNLIADRVNEAAQRITRTLSDRGEHITLALGHAGDTMIAELSRRGGDLLDNLQRTSSETVQAIGEASERLNASLSFKTDHISEEFDGLTSNLGQMLTARLNEVTDNFSQRSGSVVEMMVSRSQEITEALTSRSEFIVDTFAGRSEDLTHAFGRLGQDLDRKSAAVVEMMNGRSQQLTEAIVDTSSRLAETLAGRVEEVNSTLKATGESLVLDLSLRGGDVVAKLEETGARIADSITERSGTVSDTFHASAQNLIEVLDTRGESVRAMLAARLQTFEQMFTHGGAELAERIARDGETLGTLITRHLAEFDRTVKTYGGELVERLSKRTDEVSESMRDTIDNFDERVGSKTAEVTDALEQRLTRFHEGLDSRTQTLNDALGSRVGDIARTLAEGGKEVVAALDRRVGEVSTSLSVRGTELAETIGARIAEIDNALGSRALEVANTLDTRIGAFEQLLVGRAQEVTEQIETRSRAAADVLYGRLEELSSAISTHSGAAEQSLSQLAVSTTTAIRTTTDETGRRITALSSEVTERLRQNAGDIEQTLLGVGDQVASKFTEHAQSIASSITERGAEMTRILDQSGGGLITALTGKSQDLVTEVTRVTDQTVREIETKGLAFTDAMLANAEAIAGRINNASETATGAAGRLLQELQEASQHSTETAKETVARAVVDLEQATRTASEAASTTVNRSLQELQETTQTAIEQSKQTAAATVAEMLETHGMLRSDTTALFERLREANILLQEVLSGAHENMSSIEHTLVTRVSDFVSTMNQLIESSGHAGNRVEEHLGAFHGVTTKVLGELSDLAGRFDTHGQALVRAADTIERSNRRTEVAVGERQESIDGLIATLDQRTEELEQRLQRFSGLLEESLDATANRARDIARVIAESTLEGRREIEESLDAATARARDIAHLITESSDEGARAVVQKFEAVRAATEDERRRTSEVLHAVYEQAVGESHAMFRQASDRFTEIVEGMKRMTADMQRELEVTRGELRRGILELPQETAESTAQMRRVIVEQIEALAELNRIVARHGRGLDAAEPVRKTGADTAAAGRAETAGARRSSAPPSRTDITTSLPQPDLTNLPGPPSRRAEAPAVNPAPGNNRSGWLSDLLHRASRDETETEGSRDESAGRTPPAEDRTARHTIESLDSLSVDIARMIDHEAAAELWDRYRRGERNVFTRRLYTLQGQRAFDEIRRKYRADREFKHTVDRYVAEFERLLEEVSRDDRGQVVARTYLTSETGKVYTMLAHAAGRFD